jgi:hypothetical protein
VLSNPLIDTPVQRGVEVLWFLATASRKYKGHISTSDNLALGGMDYAAVGQAVNPVRQTRRPEGATSSK